MVVERRKKHPQSVPARTYVVPYVISPNTMLYVVHCDWNTFYLTSRGIAELSRRFVRTLADNILRNSGKFDFHEAYQLSEKLTDAFETTTFTIHQL